MTTNGPFETLEWAVCQFMRPATHRKFIISDKLFHYL
jgi:hypothetical protein